MVSGLFTRSDSVNEIVRLEHCFNWINCYRILVKVPFRTNHVSISYVSHFNAVVVIIKKYLLGIEVLRVYKKKLSDFLSRISERLVVFLNSHRRPVLDYSHHILVDVLAVSEDLNVSFFDLSSVKVFNLFNIFLAFFLSIRLPPVKSS